MEKRPFFQTVGATLSALYTAASLIPDINEVVTQGWPWAPLISFVVFVAIVMSVIYDQQKKIGEKRPLLMAGDKIGVTTHALDKKTMKKGVTIKLWFKNNGSLPAHQVRLRVGFAEINSPNSFKLTKDIISVNPWDVDGVQHGKDYSFITSYQKKDGKDVPTSEGILIYCKLDYSDKPDGQRKYNNERWYSYRWRLTGLLECAPEQQQELEPYVKLECAKMDNASNSLTPDKKGSQT